MKEKFLILYLIFFLLFGPAISPAMASGLKCNKKSGFTVYDEQNKTCINPTENLKYKNWLTVNSLVCNQKAGYTEIKDGQCYNPKTNLSYGISYNYDNEQKIHNEVYSFYYNGQYCGKNCDYDGKNCSNGFCNVNSCAQNFGYTQIKSDKCYNPNTKMSYSFDGIFYKENYYCGTNCDTNGRNCKEGGCYPLKCAKGFKTIRENNEAYICFNPQTSISYTKNGIFSVDGYPCGRNCDVTGRNCKEGSCSVYDCKLPGYTKFSSAYCINPATAFAYRYNIISNKTDFYSLKNFMTSSGNLDFKPSRSFEIRKATCNSNGANCKTIKQPCSLAGGDCNVWEQIGFFSQIVGMIIISPIMLPLSSFEAQKTRKQPDIKVNYLEKNRIK